MCFGQNFIKITLNENAINDTKFWVYYKYPNLKS